MRRLRCKAVYGYGFLVLLTLVFCYLFCLRYGVFGAKVDWISQHSVLPDYFRQQFYDTGELFPEFAANIGGGQNIYHFAYYGLYNPVLLISYLLPFVKMSDYMMAVQMISLLVSVMLMYAWLGKSGFTEKIRIGVTVIFLLSGPMIFHSYNQIMFVNYMPFLLMGLMGIDRYFPKEDGKRQRKNSKRRGGMLTVSIFLMIMTSFYFSIGGMLVLVLYGVSRYLMVCESRDKKITFGAFLAEGIRFAASFVTAVLMSGILLAPTVCALAGGEGRDTLHISIGELLIPGISASRFCYSVYGIGLTTLALTALIAMLFGNKLHERMLAISVMAVLTVPLFAYLLNGGLYVRDKVMIPFLPLLCYILAYYLEHLTEDNREIAGVGGKAVSSGMLGVLPYIITVALLFVCRKQGEAGRYWKLIIGDAFVMLGYYVSYIAVIHMKLRRNRSAGEGIEKTDKRKKNSWIILVPAIGMLLLFGYTCCIQEDRPVKRGFYEKVTDPDIRKLIAETVREEEGFCRMEQLGDEEENAANLNRVWDMDQYVSSVYSSSYNEGYREFREKTFGLEEPFRNFLMHPAVHNPVYQRFMSVKYVVSEEEVPGYELIGSKGRWNIYQNELAAPVAYATDKVITEREYEELAFPYNQLALLEYAVADDGKKDENAVTDDGKKDENAVADDGRKEEGFRYRNSRDMPAAEQLDVELPEMIKTEKNRKEEIELPVSAKEGEVLFLRFRVENPKPGKDVAVWVEGIRNKLTAENHFYYNGNTEFTYAAPLEKGQESVRIIFGKGRYKIADVEAFTAVLPDNREDSKDEEDEKEADMEDRLYQSELKLIREQTKGNCIAGTIDVKRRGYFITTIPYDENFEIQVDGKSVEGEKVNTAFLGFRTDAGEHEVRIVYHAPGVKAGKIISAVGILLFLFSCYCIRLDSKTGD
ncbi:MAG: YfhO family protein [Dorea sp.]|nr:YfhO family protein [Dorea sp.]